MLALVMVFGIAFNIAPAAEEVKASGESEKEYDYSLEIERNESSTSLVNKLKDKFKVYYYNAANELVAGPSTPSSTNVTTGYWGSHNNGYLKFWQPVSGTNYPNTGNSWDGQVGTLTYTEQTYENFKAEFSFFPGSHISGFAFGGSADAFPLTADSDNSNDTGVMIFMEASGNLTIAGAIQPDTTTYMGGNESGTDYTTHSYLGSKVANIRGASLTGKQLSPVSGTIPSGTTEYYTIVITVDKGVVTVYEKSNPENVVSVELASTFKGGYASLFVNNFRLTSFKSFSISSINYDYTADFFRKDLSNYADLNSTKFDMSTYETVATGKLQEHWFKGTSGYPSSLMSGRATEGLKPKTHNTNWHRLDLFETSDNFELVIKMKLGGSFGIAFGEQGVFPQSTNGAAGIVFYQHYISFNGAVHKTTLQGSGADFNTIDSSGAKITGWNIAGTGIANKNMTFHVKVEHSDVTFWAEEYDAVFSIQLSSAYKSGMISLISSHCSQGGGFNSVYISAIEDDANTIYFDNADLSTFTDWSSRTYDTNTNQATEANAVSDQWFTSMENYPTIEEGWNAGWTSFKNVGLKPKYIDENNETDYFTMLTYPETQKNFETSFTYYQNSSAYGIIVGPEGIYPTSVANAGIRVYLQGKTLMIVGAIDAASAISTGATDATITKTKTSAKMSLAEAGFAPSAASNTKTVTVHVKVENGKVTASVDDLAVEMTVNLTGNFAGDKISLYASSCAHGGFKKLTINQLEDTLQVENASLDYKAQSIGEYAAITLYTDTAYSNVQGELTYNAEKYEYVSAIYPVSNAMTNDNNQFVNDAVAGTIAINVLANNDEEVVTLYFKTLDGSVASDFTAFAVNGETMSIAGGNIPNNLTKAFSLEKDYHADKSINVLDLVAAKKLTTDDSADVREVLIGSNVASPLIGKTALFLGDSIAKGAGDEMSLAWAGRLANYGVLSENVAQSGWCLTVAGGNSPIVTQLSKAQKTAYDFVLLEGGVNDVLRQDNDGYNIPWGDVNSPSTEDSIAGAMKKLIETAKSEFANAKFLYVINSEFGANADNPEGYTNDDMGQYVQLVKDICNMYGVAYVDLSDTVAYPELSVISSSNENLKAEYLPDGLHPNAASYDLTTPYIASKMEELLSK